MNQIIDHHGGAFPPRQIISREITHMGWGPARLAQDQRYQHIEVDTDDGGHVVVTLDRQQAEHLARIMLAWARQLPKEEGSV